MNIILGRKASTFAKKQFFQMKYSTNVHPSITTTTQLKFFTKPECQLCYEAKNVLNKALRDVSPNMRKSIVDVQFIDITAPGNEDWFDCYRYDIPVLHVEREGYKKVVFMHKFDHEELVDELDQEI